jgi:hypothetical protein
LIRAKAAPLDHGAAFFVPDAPLEVAIGGQIWISGPILSSVKNAAG